MDKSFYTVRDIQEMFGICRTTATKIIHSEGFPMLKVDRKVYIPMAALEKWIKEKTFNPKIAQMQSIIEEMSFTPCNEKIQEVKNHDS